MAISVGGSHVAVDVAHLRALASRLDEAASPLEEASLRVPTYSIVGDPHITTLLDDLRRATNEGLAETRALAAALRSAAHELEQQEAMAARVIESLASQLVAVTAFCAVRLGLVLAPGLLHATVATLSAWAALPESWREGITDTARELGHGAAPLLSHPVVLGAVRSAFDLVDDAALGALGLPAPLVSALGDSGLGLSGLDSVAAGITTLAALAGVSGVAPVLVHQVGADARRGVGASEVEAPLGVADRVSRIPEPATPIVIERFERSDGSEWFEVYLAGTDSDAPLGGRQPWDGASNIANAAGLPSSSLQAVRAALLAAGALPGSDVVFTGYSQGGALATRLAESGEWHTLGLVTVGAPSGGTPVAGSYPAIVIEHRDDLVPTLGGSRAPTRAVVIVGEGIDGGHPPGTVLPAHELERYESTAVEVDASDHPSVIALIDALPKATQSGTRTAYTAERVTAE